jgi:hypothetical protein
MAGYSLEDLLHWMGDPQNDASVMWRWDCIAVMSRDKVNVLLLQEYINRFTTNSYFPPVSGDVAIAGDQWKESIHHFVLDAPRLSFENADINNSAAKLACTIVSGIQLTMKHHVDVWLVEKIVEIDPLQGPALFLDLNLAEVEGIVERDGRVYLDLQYSENFRLTFGESEFEQEQGGIFFRNKFNELPPEQQIWVLGRLESGAEEVMRPQSFDLRTQANSQASRNPREASFGDGAIMMLICMVGGRKGAIPPRDYCYLIPNDAGGEYSATVLFGRERASLGILVDSIATIIGNREFSYEYDEYGHLVAARATAGQIEIQGWSYPTIPVDKPVLVELANVTLPVNEAHPVVITWDDSLSSAVIDWHGSTVISTTLSSDGLDPITFNVPYALTLSAVYKLVDDSSAPVHMDRLAFSVEKHIETIDADKRAGARSGWDEVWIALAKAAAFTAFHTYLVDAVIKVALVLQIKVSTAVDPFVKEHIRLNFGKAIEGDIIRAPRDIGFFGRINPTRTSFQISPLQPLMAAGGTQPFTTEPVISGLTWAVTALPEQTGEIGSITPSGLYQAPAASDIEGRFVRVRVTATESASGYNSSALVTVLVNELTVNPLIQRCDAGGSVELKAGALGGGELHWEIKNPVEGESGWFDPIELPEGNRRYVAAPRVEKKTYVLDEIEVTHTATGAKKSVWVLATQKEPAVTLKPLTELAPLPPGQLRLESRINGALYPVEWDLPMGGPGSIDRDSEDYGLYSADPQATERFVLIVAKTEVPPFGIFEGYIILPLPLEGFPAELELMQAGSGT